MDGIEALDDRLHLAVDAARAAGERAMEYFKSRAFDVERKADGSEVTRADREAELLVREAIAATFPDDGILGEEHGEQEGTSGFRWILDPIDGTKSFVQGVPLFGTLIAVERGEDTVVGVIHMPGLDETVYAATGHGAWHEIGDAEPRPARVSDRTSLSTSLLCTTAFDYFAAQGREEVFLGLARQFGCTRGWSDCYGHVLVATGRAEAVVEPVISPWDVAPMIPIMAEAGGRYSDWAGRGTAFSPSGASSNGHIHEELLGILSEE